MTNRSNSLRQLADMLDDNTELENELDYALKTLNVFVYQNQAEELAKWMRAGKAFGATVTKEYSGAYFTAQIAFGDVIVRVNTARESVCTPTVTGKRSVTRSVPTEPIVYVEKVVEEDIIEWECHPILADN